MLCERPPAAYGAPALIKSFIPRLDPGGEFAGLEPFGNTPDQGGGIRLLRLDGAIKARPPRQRKADRPQPQGRRQRESLTHSSGLPPLRTSRSARQCEDI